MATDLDTLWKSSLWTITKHFISHFSHPMKSWG